MTIHTPSVSKWKPFVRGAAEEVDKKFPRSEWTSTYPGHGENSAVGAYAVDFLCNRTDGDDIAAYVWKHRERLGVWYIIWYGRIISRTDEKNGGTADWERYYLADDPNPSKSHKNHVHVSFYESNRNYKPYVAPKPEPKYIYVDRLNPGVKDSDSVYHLQTLLNKVNNENVVRDSWYGNQTADSVRVFQRRIGENIDGNINKVELLELIKMSKSDGYVVRDNA